MSNQVDSGQAISEDDDLTQDQALSQTDGDSKKPSGNSLAGAVLADAALSDPKAREILRKQLQSEKDQGVAQAKKDAKRALNSVDEILKELGHGQEETYKAKEAIALRRFTEDYFGDSQPSESVSAGSEVQGSASSILDFDKAFTAAGVDPQKATPEDIAFIQGFQGSQVELQNQMIVRKRTQPQNTSTSLSAQAPAGNAVAPTPEIVEKTNKYIEERTAALIKGSRVEADRLEREARQDGVNVDAVIWDVE